MSDYFSDRENGPRARKCCHHRLERLFNLTDDRFTPLGGGVLFKQGLAAGGSSMPATTSAWPRRRGPPGAVALCPR